MTRQCTRAYQSNIQRSLTLYANIDDSEKASHAAFLVHPARSSPIPTPTKFYQEGSANSHPLNKTSPMVQHRHLKATLPLPPTVDLSPGHKPSSLTCGDGALAFAPFSPNPECYSAPYPPTARLFHAVCCFINPTRPSIDLAASHGPDDDD